MEPLAPRLPILVRFKDLHEQMCIAELLALFEICGDPTVTVRAGDRQPFVHIESRQSDGETLKRMCAEVCQRAMLVEGFYEEYGCGATYDELLANLDLATLKADAYAEGTSLKVSVETYGSSLSQKQPSGKQAPSTQDSPSAQSISVTQTVWVPSPSTQASPASQSASVVQICGVSSSRHVPLRQT